MAYSSLRVALTAVLLAIPLAGVAQEYPAKAVRIIVPYPIGGASDITARLVADKLSKKWGQAVIVDNKARCQRHHRH